MFPPKRSCSLRRTKAVIPKLKFGVYLNIFIYIAHINQYLSPSFWSNSCLTAIPPTGTISSSSSTTVPSSASSATPSSNLSAFSNQDFFFSPRPSFFPRPSFCCCFCFLPVAPSAIVLMVATWVLPVAISSSKRRREVFRPRWLGCR